MKDALECVDFITADMAVNLGHLGGQHDYTRGKGNLSRVMPAKLRSAICGTFDLVNDMAGCCAKNCAKWSAQGKTCGSANNFAPDTHAVLMLCSWVNCVLISVSNAARWYSYGKITIFPEQPT